MKQVINKLKYHELPTEEYRKSNKLLCLNENPYGCSERVKKVFKSSIINFNEYPDDNCTELREKLAKLYSVSSNNIMIGNGSGELLQIISRGYLSESDEVISCGPTYPYYLVETVLENGKYVEVNLKDNKFDIDGIIKSVTDKTKIIYITNPNNPLGTIINEEDVRKLINSIRKDILIVFDEAYFEYVTSDDFPDIIGYMKEYENVCVLRTFSKAYGLASLRIGYIIGNEKVIDSLNKVRLTFNISRIGQILAGEALEDQEFIKKCREKNKKQKEKLYKCLDELGIEYIPSETNFVMIEDKDNIIFYKLKSNNIIVKTLKYDNKSYIRFSLCKDNEMDRIIEIIS